MKPLWGRKEYTYEVNTRQHKSPCMENSRIGCPRWGLGSLQKYKGDVDISLKSLLFC